MTEKAKLEAEIARLTGAIRHRQSGPASTLSHPYKSFAPKRNMTLIVDKSTSSAPSTAAAPVASTSKSIPTNAAESAGPSNTPLSGGSTSTGWVKSSSRSGNKSLMNPDTYAKTQKARLARVPKPPPAKPARRSRPAPIVQSYYSSGTAQAANNNQLELKKRVVIDGVVFEFEEGGTKLKRLDELSPAKGAGFDAASTSGSSTPTRHTLSMSGHQYLRTKSNNLIAAEKVRRRKSAGGKRKAPEKIDKPCRYFTKTGRCKRAATCPFKHDPNRLAICSKFLRGNCPHTASTCPVSHSPSPHNTPSCQHFQRTGECRNGQGCLYPHVRVADDAPVCEDFAVEGWCDLGDSCGERHAWECRQFNETGQCDRGTRCGLLHILRAKKGVEEKASAGAVPAPEADLKEETAGDAADELQTRDEIEAQQDFIQFRMDSDAGSDVDDGDESGEGDEDDGEASSVHSDDEDKTSETELSFTI